MLKGIARVLNFGINAKDESISNVDLAQILPPNKILVGVKVLQLGVLGCWVIKLLWIEIVIGPMVRWHRWDA